MKKDVERKLLEERSRRAREVPEFVFDFILSIFNLAISTQIEYIKDISKFLTYLLEIEQFENEKISVMDFTPQDLGRVSERDIINFEDYLLDYKKTFIKKDGTKVTQRFNNTEAGQARKLATLHKLYKYLLRNKFIDSDPSAPVEIKLEKKLGITNLLDDDEFLSYMDTIMYDKNVESDKAMAFHNIIKKRDYVISLILGYVGIRVSELVQLDITDINLDKGTMIVHRKGKKTQVLDLPFKIIEPLAEYIDERKKIKGINSEYKDALFISLHKKRINPRTVRYLVNKYKQRAKISIKVTPHTFRRTFATKLLDITGNIELARDVLGHESSETARKHYALLNKKKERAIMQDFDYFNENLKPFINKNLNIEQLKKISEKTGLSIDELIKTLSED